MLSSRVSIFTVWAGDRKQQFTLVTLVYHDVSILLWAYAGSEAVWLHCIYIWRFGIWLCVHETHIPIKTNDKTGDRQQLTGGGCWVILIWIRRSGLLLVRSSVRSWWKSVIPSSWVFGKVLSSHDDDHVVISLGQTAISPYAKIGLDARN